MKNSETKQPKDHNAWKRYPLCWCGGLALCWVLPFGLAWSADIQRVSVDAQGAQGNSGNYQAGSNFPTITANGRYVVFQSYAINLVQGDSNGHSDIFLKDIKTGAVTRVSTDAQGAQGNSASAWPKITPDGRYVVFASYASNLVPGDSNGQPDIFRKDMKTGTLTRVSTDAQGAQSNFGSIDPTITPDGRYVVFQSYASNLVPGDGNGHYHIFRKDLKSGAVTRVSTDAQGVQGNFGGEDPEITANGRYVVFTSFASNLVQGDSNGQDDIFLKDIETGAVTRISTDAQDAQGNDSSDSPAITPDGRYVVFSSKASNLVPGDGNGQYDIFRKDLKSGAVTRVSTDAQGVQGNDSSGSPEITANGRYVVFTSLASNLVPGDSNGQYDIFRKDLKTGAVTRISTDAQDAQGNSNSYSPAITANGRYVVFQSYASNLVPGDTNENSDIFRYEFSRFLVSDYNPIPQ